MDAGTYTTLTRQSGLLREMDVIAQNIANVSTSGFRREGVVFSEFVSRMEGAPSLSMALGNTRRIDLSQGGMTQTGGTFDLAIEGEGFFMVETPAGARLTRAGGFTPDAQGELVTPDGYRLLDAGGAPVFVPPGGRAIGISADGTVSSDGVPLTRIGLWRPADPNSLRHEAGTLFAAGETVPAEVATMRQGALEDSNVDPLTEIARMIEVQRAYEMGQSFLDREDQRILVVVQTLGR